MTLARRLVIDASVAIKWYIPEDQSDAAVSLLESGDTLLAPDLILAEVGNIVWKKARRGELTAEEGRSIVGAFSSLSRLALVRSTALLSGALEIALTFDQTIYDSLYLALAVSENAHFVTADERLVRALAGTELEDTARLL